MTKLIVILSLLSTASFSSMKHNDLVRSFMNQLENSYSVQCPDHKSLVLNCSNKALAVSSLTLLEGRLDCKGITTHRCLSTRDSTKGITVKIVIKGQENKFKLRSIKIKPFNGFVLD